MTWLSAGDGYEVMLDAGKVVARNSAGKQLKSVPAVLKTDSTVVDLRQLASWLEQHTRDAGSQVEAWMIRSLPVTRSHLIAVWPDPAWRDWLRDLVVVPAAGGSNSEVTGLLRDVDPSRGIGLVNLDGETMWLTDAEVHFPHPVLLLDVLDDLREFAVQLGVEQRLPQLLRETWSPGARDSSAVAVTDFAGGKYEQLRHLVSRANSLGYSVRGGYAVCRLWDDGGPLEARVWVGAEDPAVETETGDLVWVRNGRSLPLGSVGEVSYSEGMRMAAALWAGRKVSEADNDLVGDIA